MPARPRAVRRATVALTALCLAAGGVTAIASPASATPSPDLLLSEVYGGGGNTGATYTNDFIELVNRGSAPIDLTGWSVQYHSSGATGSWQVTALSGQVQPGAYYLVAEAAGAGGTTPLPTPQATGTIAMSATAGTVAVADTTAALTCTTGATCDDATTDLVGYGSTAIYDASPATGASNTASEQRGSGADTDDNAADFTAGAPTPQAGSGGGGGGTPATIDQIQGDAFLSPLAGQQVTEVHGIVTALRTASSKGFWMQDPAADSDPATSEGIFVYTSTTPTVSVGDDVTVAARVSEYYPLNTGETTSTTSQLSITELTAPTVTVNSAGNPLPAPVAVTSTTLPNVYAPNLGGANIESTPITPTRSALDWWEAHEGMLVSISNARVVGPSNQYGEQYVTTKPAQDKTYRGGTELKGENQTPSGRVEIKPLSGVDPGVNVNDVFTGTSTGVVDYSNFGGYLIQATALGAVRSGNLQKVVATPQASDQLAVATYNVENLAPTDPQTKFDALAAGIVTNLATPDIVALEEVQDNSGATDDGTVAADQTIAKLTSAITAAGGPSYDYREIDPVNDQDGGQPGGNIRVVYLFNPARVSFVDSGAAGVDRSTTATRVLNKNGQPALSLSPGRIQPTNTAWDSTRKPLVGQFVFQGQPVFVIANHWSSKLGDQNGDGRYQYPDQVSEAKRVQQAAAVHTFVQQILNVSASARVIVLGDLNDFQFSPSVNKLVGKPGILTDLITTLPVNQQYTYVYNGVSQVLDHILTTGGFGSTQYQVVHINAEFTDQTSDHDPQVVRVTT